MAGADPETRTGQARGEHPKELFYKAQRASKVEEYEDEDPHYFVELNNSEVLYMSGQ
jgi:hypothetical protein